MTLQNEIDKRIKEIMVSHFDYIIDKEAPKQPNGSPERALALMIGGWIIAKSIPEITTLIQDREKKASEKALVWIWENGDMYKSIEWNLGEYFRTLADEPRNSPVSYPLQMVQKGENEKYIHNIHIQR